MTAGRPLRVALAIGTLNLGGAETQVVGLARQLKQMGVAVEVLLITARGPLQSTLDDAGIPTYCAEYPGLRGRNGGWLKPWLPITDVWRFLRFVGRVRRRRYDVIHAFLFHAYVIMVPLGWVMRIPVRVAGRRGLYAISPRGLLLRPLLPLANRLSTAIVANAEAVADDARTNEGIPTEKLCVIRNAVDLPGGVASPGVAPPIGLMVANLIYYKGHLDLVRALALMEAPPKIRCIGEGPMRSEIESALSHANLMRTVSLEGSVFRARDSYLQVQFAVLTSHSEGMPNAILEAMAAGLPVVATDVGGCRELVVDGITGLIVPPRDPEALAIALSRIVEDDDFRVKAGALARARALKFSWESTAEAHLDLYRNLLRGRELKA